MPNIVPISDLRNYTKVLEQVDSGQPVYLTRNGRGKYMITRLDDYDREATIQELLQLIQEGTDSLEKDGGIPFEDVAKKFGFDV